MNRNTALGWLAYFTGLIWYVYICIIAAQWAGGDYQWIVPAAGAAGWSLAAALVRWRLR